MTEKKEAKFLKYDDLLDIPKQQIQEHYAVYEGQIKKFNGMPTSDKEKMSVLNSIKLHEGYFDNIGGTGRAGGHIIDLLERGFGSVDDWEREFRELAAEADEWLVLAYDMEDNKLRHVLCSDSEALWNCVALLVFCAHEHAYSKMDKSAYIEAFIKNIDWEYVNTLLGKFGIR